MVVDGAHCNLVAPERPSKLPYDRSDSDSLYELGLETNTTHNAPFSRPNSEDFENYYLPEAERNFYSPNPGAAEPPQLNNGSGLVPSNGENNYQSKVYINPLLDSTALTHTETSVSVKFLHQETILDHFLSTYIDKFDLLSQVTWNGVWGFFVTIVRFIYGLHKLHFFFLFSQKIKIKKLMKWWGKKFK